MATIKTQTVKGWDGTVYIRANGDVDPPGAPLLRSGSLYIQTNHINCEGVDGIVIEKDDVEVDGDGYRIRGPGWDESGIYLYGRSNVTLRNVNVGGFVTGIDAFFCSALYVLDSRLAGNVDGLDFHHSSNTTVSGNTVLNNFEMNILLSNCTGFSVIGNNVTHGACGIAVSDSSRNTISRNNFTSNTVDGISFTQANYTEVNANSLTKNKCGMEIQNSWHITIRECLVKDNNESGISLKDCHFSSLVENEIKDNNLGVYLGSSDSNTLRENNISSNSMEGVYLNSSSFNTLTFNLLANNIYGLRLRYSSITNLIRGNNLAQNTQYGVSLYTNCAGNTIRENSIASSYYGLWLGASSNNTIYHNNIINNTNQAYGVGISNNFWDDGYPSGGNYWSDYFGIDEKSGVNQDQPGSDGIGDTPYVINPSNTDHYPFMWAHKHDIAIKGLLTSKTVVGQGGTVFVNVTVTNPGDYREVFNVTISVGRLIYTTIAHFHNVTLDPGKGTILSYSWDTAGWSCWNYTVSTYASQVPGEPDIDNNYPPNPKHLLITIPGDSNGDKTVNILDLILVANHLGHIAGGGHTRYSPEWYKCMNTDIQGDNFHNVLDLIICANHLGQSW